MRILITGASGSGTTTLGRALADRLKCTHLDADDYFWLPTDPPFTDKRDPVLRLRMILHELGQHRDAVISGSVMEWGAELEDSPDLVVFLYLDVDVRIRRLRKREMAQLGRVDEEFIRWAAGYDTDPGYGRSLKRHLAWIVKRTCPVVRIEGDLTVEERMERVMDALETFVPDKRKGH